MLKISNTSSLLPSKTPARRFWVVPDLSVRQVTIIVALFLIFAALAPMERGTHFSVVWKSSQDRTARGLSLYALSEQGSISHLLIEGPNLQLLTLTKIIDAGRGTRKIRIADGISGWWIEMAEDYGTGWTTFTTALRSIAEGPDKEKKDSVFTLALHTSDGFDFETTLPWRLGGFDQNLLVALEDRRLRGTLARSIPSSVREVIQLLTEALAADVDPARRIGLENGSLLGLCKWVLEVERGVSELKGETWMFAERGDYHLGLTPAEPEQIELVSKFPSLENTDPMRGLRPSDLFSPEDPER